MKYFSKNAVCDKCGAKKEDFKTARLFQQHYDDHFDLALPCNECPKTFSTKIKLRDHIRKVHKVKDQCNMCEKMFSTKSNLNMHKRKFHDSNNYPSSDIIDITNDSMDFIEDSADEVPGLINESWEALDESDVDDILIDSSNMDQLGFPRDIKQESSEDVDGHLYDKFNHITSTIDESCESSNMDQLGFVSEVKEVSIEDIDDPYCKTMKK